MSGKNLGVDGTTLEANAALRSIVRRDNGASYDEHVKALMKAEGIGEPTPAQRQRFDRKRKKSLSNRDWVNPHDREARITKMKDGCTHMANKAEHAVDLDTGAVVVVAVTVQPADRGDTASLLVALAEGGSVVTEMAGQAANETAVGPVKTASELGVERVIADPERKLQKWSGQGEAQASVYANRRLKAGSAKALMRKRGEQIERSFAHLYNTGGMRRVNLSKNDNIAKRLLIHAAAFNLSLILRQVWSVGTARQAADLSAGLCFAVLRLLEAATRHSRSLGLITPPVRASCRNHRIRCSCLGRGALSTGCWGVREHFRAFGR